MYIPQAFAQTDPAKLARLIHGNSFGELVTVDGGLPSVSHLPFLFEPAEGSHGVLSGHMARANPHWKQGEGPALAIFTGPHQYISPTWYEAEGTVPTWAYLAVHARGVVNWSEDPADCRRVLEQLVATHEEGRARPWSADFDSPELVGKMRGIVTLRIEVECLVGQWKFNQNHPPERQARTARALRKLPGEDAQAIATLMEEEVARRSRED